MAEKKEEEKENCHMLITAALNEGGRDKKTPKVEAQNEVSAEGA